MTTLFSSHFQELGNRIVYCLISWFITAIIAYEMRESVLLWIIQQIFIEEIEIITVSLPEALWNFLLLSFWAGFLLTWPLVMLSIYSYFRPGLYQYEASFWDKYVGVLIVGWIPYHWWQITHVWPEIAKWFLSYSQEYVNLTYLPTMNQIFSFLVNWSTITSMFFVLFLTLIARILRNKEGNTMYWYWRHREKYLIGSLFVGGLITPPDVISQILVGMVLIGVGEILVMIESIKQASSPPPPSREEGIRSSVGRAAIF